MYTSKYQISNGYRTKQHLHAIEAIQTLLTLSTAFIIKSTTENPHTPQSGFSHVYDSYLRTLWAWQAWLSLHKQYSYGFLCHIKCIPCFLAFLHHLHLPTNTIDLFTQEHCTQNQLKPFHHLHQQPSLQAIQYLPRRIPWSIMITSSFLTWSRCLTWTPLSPFSPRSPFSSIRILDKLSYTLGCFAHHTLAPCWPVSPVWPCRLLCDDVNMPCMTDRHLPVFQVFQLLLVRPDQMKTQVYTVTR